MAELLAPAGSREAFVAAVESGADAVYLGGRMFGARHYAPNFSDEELAGVVRDAHLRDVAVYVTVNTLVDNNEIPALEEYLSLLYNIGVDAIIVQDVGVAMVARQVAPDLPVHASTQMTVHNLEGVLFLAEQGFARVVLARELTLEEIRHICQNSPVEIETFVHGALCISYSGQCLMSSMIGGRSGNRGKCAQPCRLPYTLVDTEGKDVLAGVDAGEYLLSPKDFSTIELLPALIEAGVASFKIEGRMKRAEYVAVVVDSYRRAMDAYAGNKADFVVPAEDPRNMAQIFNRGFTTAYLKDRPGRNMMSDRRPNNRGVRIGRVLDYNAKERTATIKLDEPLQVGDIVEFWVKVGGRASATVTSIKLGGKPADFADAGVEAAIPVEKPVKPGDRVFKTFDIKLMEKARGFFTAGSPLRRIPVDVTATVSEGQPFIITLQDDTGCSGEGRTDFLAEKALKRPLDEETVIKQVGRLGATVFSMRMLDCRINGQVMVPVSEINEARRKAVEALEEARLARYNRPPIKKAAGIEVLVREPAAARTGRIPKLVVNVDAVDKVTAALQGGADVVMFGGENLSHKHITAEAYRQVASLARERGKGFILATPRLVRDWQMSGLVAQLELFRELAPDAISVANLGTLHFFRRHSELKLHADYPLNIYNSIAVDFFRGQGLASITLSPELTLGQVEDLAAKSDIALECLVHGHLPLMISEYCVLGSFLGNVHSGKCSQPCQKGEYWLKDRMSELFRVTTDQFCRMHVLNAKELSMLPHVPRFARMGLDRIRIEGKIMKPREVEQVTRIYRQLLDVGEDHPLFKKDNFGLVEHADITRGHYFRGVL